VGTTRINNNNNNIEYLKHYNGYKHGNKHQCSATTRTIMLDDIMTLTKHAQAILDSWKQQQQHWTFAGRVVELRNTKNTRVK